jgi:hypothetical protein
MMPRKRLIDDPRERLQLMVEIWAVSTRNPVIAAIQGEAHGRSTMGQRCMTSMRILPSVPC